MAEVQNRIEKRVIEQFQNGNEEALNEIFLAYKDKIYFMAYYFFEDAQKAEDIVQDTFIKVYQSADQLKAPEAFHVWINKIAYHTCVEKTRRKKFSIVEGDDVTTIEDFADGEQESAMDILDRKEIKKAVMEGIKDLSLPLKSVALLRFYEGLDIEEIAEILDISTNVVNVRINRAKKQLKENLKKQDVSPEIYKLSTHPFAMSGAFAALAITSGLSSININEVMKTVGTSTASLSILGKIRGVILSNVKFATVSTTAVVVGVVGSYVALSNQNDQQVVVPDNSGITQTVVEVKGDEKPVQEELSKIESVSYNTELTNQPIILSVTTSNDNYDKILVNGNEDLNINENGTYEVSLVKESKIISTYEVNIQNIDIIPPTQKEVFKNGNDYLISYQDNLSNINSSNIEVYEDGQLYTNYTFDVNSNTLTLSTTQGKEYIIFVADNAGNYLKTVSSIE